jgi:hypothetical protein
MKLWRAIQIFKSSNLQIIKSLLSTTYLPPVQYISKLIGGDVFIEKHENFQKQSYRNRCYIYGANGIQCLVIPVTAWRKNANNRCGN